MIGEDFVERIGCVIASSSERAMVTTPSFRASTVRAPGLRWATSERAGGRQQIQHRERGDGDQAGMQAGGAEGRFVVRHDLGRRERDDHLLAAPAGNKKARLHRYRRARSCADGS